MNVGISLGSDPELCINYHQISKQREMKYFRFNNALCLDSKSVKIGFTKGRKCVFSDRHLHQVQCLLPGDYNVRAANPSQHIHMTPLSSNPTNQADTMWQCNSFRRHNAPTM